MLNFLKIFVLLSAIALIACGETGCSLGGFGDYAYGPNAPAEKSDKYWGKGQKSISVLVDSTMPNTKRGGPFPVVGEQLVHQPPKGWKLAWMIGDSDGEYLKEYIPNDEDINSWRKGYLGIRRLKYPPAETLNNIKKQKISPADFALYRFIEGAKEDCGGQHVAMPQKTEMLSGVHFAVGGGFCNKYGLGAPFGAGAIVSFIEGADYIFRIEYQWKPESIQMQGDNLPWRISPEKIKEYLSAIKSTTLCGRVAKPDCKGSD